MRVAARVRNIKFPPHLDARPEIPAPRSAAEGHSVNVVGRTRTRVLPRPSGRNVIESCRVLPYSEVCASVLLSRSVVRIAGVVRNVKFAPHCRPGVLTARRPTEILALNDCRLPGACGLPRAPD